MLASRSGGSLHARVDEVLEFVGLANAAGRAVGAYSLGMRQRLSVAGALLGEPNLLVLDEPANGLDPEGIRWLRDFLRTFAADGGTVFISSHVLGGDAAARRRGRDHPPRRSSSRTSRSATLTARAAGGTRRALAAGGRLRETRSRGRASRDSLDGDRARHVAAPPERVGELAAANADRPARARRGRERALEEAFLELTGGDEIR